MALTVPNVNQPIVDQNGYASRPMQLFMGGVAPAILNYKVAGLPQPARGLLATVTDGDAGLAWGATVINSGVGATTYLVWYNGTNWTVAGK